MNTAMHTVAVAGEALIDLIQRPTDGAFEPCLGGAVYNMARALSLQGVHTHFLNPFSRDAFGRQLAQQLLTDGVHLSAAQPVPQSTSLAVVGLDGQGHPHYAFYRDGVADRQVTAEGLTHACSALPALGLVCTGGLALDPRDAPVYLPWLASQRQRGLGVAVDVNMRPSVMPDLSAYRGHALRTLAMAHLVKVSDEDLGHLQCPGRTPLEQARTLFQHGDLELVALTLGPDGACLLHRSGETVCWKEPNPVAVVDTVGAGDSFFAGLLASLLRHAAGSGAPSFQTALAHLTPDTALPLLRHAVASASLCVQQRGCVPPTWRQSATRAHTAPA